ncbi:unnamed protein product [Ambrosiozyma monospora]|uniref:Unnamed protein product n=1 Tax=Ambrosiozyma monospora TaxID=43982 RepID=A0ACB5T794_AMBMO|nr:unnamed protein product [Ambrosiozyma monospora]
MNLSKSILVWAIAHLKELVLPESSDSAIRTLTEDTVDMVNRKLDQLTRYAHVLQYADVVTKETDEMILASVQETVCKIKDQVYNLSESADESNVSTSKRNSARLSDLQPSLLTQHQTLPASHSQPQEEPHHHSLQHHQTQPLPQQQQPFQQQSLLIHSPQPVPIQSPQPRAARRDSTSMIFGNLYLDNDIMPHSSKLPSKLSLTTSLPDDRLSSGSSTPRSSILSGSRTTPVINYPEELRKTSSNGSTPNNYNSPRRPLSPSYNAPLSSIQRNSKSGIKSSVPSGPNTSGSNTPLSSPLLLYSDPHNPLSQHSHSSSIQHGSLSHHSSLSHHHHTSSVSEKPQLSPLLVPQNSFKPSLPSIKDYEVIKPISKGAFGSVFLVKRKLTGEYFAMKVLKKSDMVAKNQVTNVKSERAIMMAQSDCKYVVQLVSSFQSQNYLYLVMEYLNGGDLATLLKNMGSLPDAWARRYISEVIVGVDDLHSRGIVHRDLKPDNLLIDRDGHAKLTDFGLSRMGLIRRQNQATSFHTPHPSISGNVLDDPMIFSTGHSPANRHKKMHSIVPFSLTPTSPLVTPNSVAGGLDEFDPQSLPSHDFLSRRPRTFSNASSNPGSSPLLRPLHRSSSQTSFIFPSAEEPKAATENVNFALFDPQHSVQTRKFVGTPDYLAPETVAGLGQDEASDWWSIGCILFEFLFGYPPFHADSPEKVFENILHCEIDWPPLPEDEFHELCSDYAKDLIEKLLVKDPTKRLGFNGSKEIMDHPYFHGINWSTLFDEEASFVPEVEDPESTDYFDDRGAELSMFPTDKDEEDDGEDEDIVDEYLSRHTTHESPDDDTAIADDHTETSSHSRSNIPHGLNIRSNSSSSSATIDSPRQSISKAQAPPPSTSKRERRSSKLSDAGSEFA